MKTPIGRRGLPWPDDVSAPSQQHHHQQQQQHPSPFHAAAAEAWRFHQPVPPPMLPRDANLEALIRADQQRRAAAAFQAAAAPPLAPLGPRPQQRARHVIDAIADSESEDNHVPPQAAAAPKRKKHKKSDASDKQDGTQKKKRKKQSKTSGQAASRPLGGSSKNPIIPGSAQQPPQLSGQFVTGVLSGRFLEMEKEANLKRAFSNIVMCCAGDNKDFVENPPAQMNLSLVQAHVLANGFLTDRNRAVSEAVRIAFCEMQAKHEGLMTAEREKLAKEREQLEREKKREAQRWQQKQQDKRSDRTNEIKYAAEIMQLKEAMKKEAAVKDKEIALLKKQLQQQGKSPGTNMEQLREENAYLKEKLEYSEKRQERSLSAYMQASVHSLHLLQKKRNSGEASN